MENYLKRSERKKGNKEYMADVVTSEDGKTLIVTDGNGKKSYFVNNPQNKQIIANRMEDQMRNYGIGRKRYHQLMAGVNSGVFFLAETGAVVIGTQGAALCGASDAGKLCVTGAAIVLATACTLKNGVRGWAKLAEINKIQYRDERKNELANIASHSHTLDNTPDSIRKLLEEDPTNPFCISNTSEYTKGQLEKLVEEMEKEDFYKKLGLTYAEEPKTKSKIISKLGFNNNSN